MTSEDNQAAEKDRDEQAEALAKGEVLGDEEVTEQAQADKLEIAENTDDATEVPADWQEKYNELNDIYVRSIADNENFKKRILRDRQNEKATASKDAVLAMLPVIDNLERAVTAAQSHLEGKQVDGGLKQLFEGVELTLKSFETALQKLDVERIACELGKPFDPHTHQALFQEENAEVEDGSILEVLQAGFSLSGQVIRPAMVKVSRKP